MDLLKITMFLFCLIGLTYNVVGDEMKDVDESVWAKCSLEYMREIIMKSCIRPHPNKKPKNKREVIQNVAMDDALMAMLPVNATITITRHKRGMSKEEQDTYFAYCCNDIKKCENMDCPD